MNDRTMDHRLIELNLRSSIAGQISTKIFNEFDVRIENEEELCRQSISRHLEKALGHVANLLSEMMPQEEMVLWIDVNDDLGDKRPDSLASFDSYRTGISGKYAFWISSHLIYDTICEELDLPDTRDMTSQTAVWVHELIHMADHKNIRQFINTIESEQEGYQAQQPSQLRLMREFSSDPDSHTPREWQLLAVLNHYRCEGIAQLHSAVTGLEPLLTTDREQAIAQFRHYFAPMVDFLTRTKTMLLPQGAGNAWQNHVNLMRSAAYVLGPWMVLDSIKTAHSDLEPLSEMAAKAIKDGCFLTTEAACRLTSAALKMDLGHFLMALTSPVNSQKGESFLKLDELTAVAHFLTIDDAQLGEYPNFLSRIIECHLGRDHKGFLRLMREVIGFPMTSQEIQAAMQNYKAEKYKADNLAKDALNLAQVIFQKWTRTNEELLSWVLTYMLDPEDLIHDSLSYIGLMDDLYVMRAGLKLAGSMHCGARALADVN